MTHESPNKNPGTKCPRDDFPLSARATEQRAVRMGPIKRIGPPPNTASCPQQTRHGIQPGPCLSGPCTPSFPSGSSRGILFPNRKLLHGPDLRTSEFPPHSPAPHNMSLQHYWVHFRGDYP
ncbi:hypothetical protein KL911_004633 [Ogataea haglerorum]|uniref:uncharacterized protein n=1 Tax=Ogataea haglerorum TaxID=1937702 RepID=UPI001C89C5F0|nr:uncharacterized protein KL911_004633 [Ogataea haglerorum]KAG7750754.1 hypothetical protein KL911_004633 [Ogataea haglerorum]